MKTKLTALLLATLALLTTPTVYAENLWSTGVGYQNGGIVGVQYGYLDDSGDNKYYASLGLVGVAVGYDTVISRDRKHSMGVVLGAVPEFADHGFLLLTYNYHFTAFQKSGFQIGVNAGIRIEDGQGIFGGGEKKSSTHGSLGISLAYKY